MSILPPSAGPQSYEEAFESLNYIVKTMETGEQSLEQTMRLMTQARELLDYCHAQLDKAEEQLTILQEGSPAP